MSDYEFRKMINDICTLKWKDPEFMAQVSCSSHYFAFISGADIVADTLFSKINEAEKKAAVIESSPVVYAEKKGGFQPWHNVEFVGATHRARLILIEELPKVPCKHEPSWQGLKTNLVVDSFNNTFASVGTTCSKCGVKLWATWKESK